MLSLLNQALGVSTLRRGMLATATVVVSASAVLAQNTLTVKGVVVDTKNEPIIGANVRVKGTTQGAATDLDGKFTITGVSRNATLEISYVGMKTLSVLVNGQANHSIVLRDDASQLSEHVVVGYGRQKKANLTGAVSSVDAKALAARPVQNVGQVLQGMVPGLNLSTTNSGGALDGRMNINIRGTGTIGSGSNSGPLVLVDGVEGDMNTLAPTDIENISVLKDASASSIYGSRAAFGVILITTKSGKEGKTRINYNGNLRLSSATQVPKMMDSEMFANYFNRAQTNSGASPIFSTEVIEKIKKYKEGSTDPNIIHGVGPASNFPVNKEWAIYSQSWANTDWFDFFYNKNVPSHEHNLSVSGGTDKLNYYVSGGLLSQRGLLSVAKDQFNRFNVTAKVGAKLTNWLEVNYINRWTREDYERPTYMTGLFFHNIARRWPTNPVYTPNGTYLWGQETIQLAEGGRQNAQTDYSNQQLSLIAKPIEGLFLKAENNYNLTYRNAHWAVLPVYYMNAANERVLGSWNGGEPGYSEVHESGTKNMFFSGKYYAEYAKEFGKHDFKIVGGMDLDINRYRSLSGLKTGLITEQVPTINTATGEKPNLSAGYSHWSTMGFFSRINYAFDGRYLLELSIRRDGSSRFIGDKTWGTFPSFSAGWNVANEAFWGGLKKTISQLKLRGSYGALGNTNIQSLYPWFLSMPISVATERSGSGWLLNGQRQTISSAPGIVSSTLTWERIVSWNVGLDFAAFNNRLQGTFDYFVRDTRDMVGPPAPLTSFLGADQPESNNADLRSKGWELELRWRDQIKDFKYGAKLVLSDNIVEVTKYYNPTGNISNWYPGRRVGDIWGYTTAGIAQSNQEMTDHLAKNRPSWGNNWAEGDIMYRDLNGDGLVNNGKGTLENHGDLNIIGNSSPRYSFSLNLDAAWKGFDFSIFLQGIGKRDFYTNQPYFSGANQGSIWQAAGFVEHWDFYRPEGDPLGANKNAYFPRPAVEHGPKNFTTQTRFLQDASYLRIKNIQLGYTLPQSLSTKFGVNSLRAYVSVDNLTTFTKLTSIFDPEALGGDWGSGKLYPLQRVWSFGLNVGI